MASSLHKSKQKILGKIVGLVYLIQDEMTTTTTRYSHIFYSLKKNKSKSFQHRHGAGALVVAYIIVIYLQAAPSSLARIRISSFNITQKYQPATHIEQKHCSLHQHDEYRQCSKVFRLETICPQLSPQRFYFLSIPLVTWKMGSWRYFINRLTQRCPYCIIRTIVNSNLFFCLPALSETAVLNL